MNKEQALRKRELKVENVDVPEWEGSVGVKQMTSKERDAFEATVLDKNGDPILDRFRAKLVIAATVNDDGTPLFDETDLDALAEQPATAIGRIYDVAKRLNHIGSEFEEKVEDARKN